MESRVLSGRPPSVEADGEAPPRKSSAQRRLPAAGGASAQRTTAATVIYRGIRAAIVAMELKPGAPLNEKALSERHAVSRTPVREAMIRLVEDGLVEVFPQSGTFVARIPVSLIPEAVVIRQALERATVERAARFSCAEDIARIDDILARQRFFSQRKDLPAFHESDEAFHEAIACISGHPGIWRYLKPAKLQIDRARQLTLPTPGRMELVLSEHHVIRDAIAANDVAAATAAMERHLNAVIPDIEGLRRAFPDYFD